MGNKSCKTSTHNNPVEKEVSKNIDKALHNEKKEKERELKLLLLGPGESGKSTLLKQMKLIYGTGFSNTEIENCKEVLYMNVVKGMQSLIDGAETLELKLLDDNIKHGELIKTLKGFDEHWTKEVGLAIKNLWNDPAIKKAFEKRYQFQVYEQVAFFFDHIDRISNPNFKATEEDFIKARMPTTGVAETMFELEKHKFRVVDVGGQRSERKKWVSCFPDVTCVLFVAALSEIDQALYEESGINRLKESLDLFEITVNNEYFSETPVILFLNKEDILRDKLDKGIDPSLYFTNYNGGCNYDLITTYLKAEFLARNKTNKREVFVRLTNATDRKNMKFVFDAVTSIILQARLESVGFI